MSIPRSSPQNPDRVQLREHDHTDWLQLSDTALDALDQLNADSTRIRTEYGRDGAVRLHSTQYVGTIALPDGPEIRITPKAAGTNFLPLLQYAHDINPTTYDNTTAASSGATFVDALAALFTAELDRILTRTPHHEYTHVERTETQLRGQLNVQRQLQRQGPTPTEFEVTYDQLTSDTVANRGIYHATRRLTHLVDDPALSSQLQRQHQQLRNWVSTDPVRPAELARIESTRLNDHYDTILRLAEQILNNTYLNNFAPNHHSSFGLLVNMNTIFENAVERATHDALHDFDAWTATPQSQIQPIATGGTPSVNMYPDVVITHNDDVKLVADAKWKTGTISQADIYQMTAYTLAHNVPGLLLYPEQPNNIETSYLIDDRHQLLVRELATQQPTHNTPFTIHLINNLHTTLTEVLDLP